MHAVLRVLHLFGRTRRMTFDDGTPAVESESAQLQRSKTQRDGPQPELFLPDTMCTDEFANERRSDDDRGDP
jgi:hypothetical protein